MPPTRKEATSPDTAFIAPELVARLKHIEVVQELFDAHKVVIFSLHKFQGSCLRRRLQLESNIFLMFVKPEADGVQSILQVMPLLADVGV